MAQSDQAGRSTISESARPTWAVPGHSMSRCSGGGPGLRTGLQRASGWSSERRLPRRTPPSARNPLVVIYAFRLEAMEGEDRAAGGKIVRKDLPVPGRPPIPLTDPAERAGGVGRSVA